MTKSRKNLIIGVILILGVIIRIYYAIKIPFWADEQCDFTTALINSYKNLLLQHHWNVSHPPLFYLFLKTWQKISIQPFFLRLPSIIASIFSLYFVVKIFKKIKPNNWIFQTIGIFLFSISFVQISIGFQLRSYAFEATFMLLSIYYFLDIITKKVSWKSLIIFSLINLLAFFQDYSSVWLFFSYAIYSLYFFTKTFINKSDYLITRNLILGGLSSLLACSLWLPKMLINLDRSLALELILPKPEWDSPFLHVVSDTSPNGLLVRLGIIPVHFYHWFTMSVVILTIILFISNTHYKNILYFFIITTLLPPISSMIYSSYITTIFTGRNLIISNIAFLFLLTFFWEKIISLLKGRLKILLIPIICIVLLNFKIGYLAAYQCVMEVPYDWRPIIKKLQTYPKSKKKYILNPGSTVTISTLAYYNKVDPVPNLSFGLENYNIIVNDYHEYDDDDLIKLSRLKNSNESFYVFLTFPTWEKNPTIDHHSLLHESKKDSIYLKQLFNILDCQSPISADYIYFAECTLR